MLTVLLGAIAVTRPVVPRTVVAMLALLICSVALSGMIPLAAALLLALALTCGVWKLVARRAKEREMQSLRLWVSRIARAALLLFSVGAVVFVAAQIMTDKPGMLAPAYVAMYLFLLCPLFFGLIVGLQPASPKNRGDGDGLAAPVLIQDQREPTGAGNEQQPLCPTR